jgi:hypothetical protein
MAFKPCAQTSTHALTARANTSSHLAELRFKNTACIALRA